jgi:hypothetical protein
MPDLFNGAAHSLAERGDLFGGKIEDPFRWVVGIFAQDGATRAIIKANKCKLLTYYPIVFSKDGEPRPLFRNYLFVEFREYVTIDLCRNTPKFIKVLTAHDGDGILRPILVRRDAVDENRAMVLANKFNERIIDRRFYGRGSIVAVLHGVMATRKVRLEENITPDMSGNRKIKIDMNGVRAAIEIHQLAL